MTKLKQYQKTIGSQTEKNRNNISKSVDSELKN